MKQAGAPCPSCGAAACAEFAMKDRPPQWRGSCGAGGPLAGSFMDRGGPQVKPTPTKSYHKGLGKAS